MLAKESGSSNFDLPEEVLEVLPPDPFEQLDVARKITSLALSTRVSALESESSALREKLAEKDRVIADLQSQVESLDASLSETADKLARADQEKEGLVKEKAVLANTVRKLNRDVSKLEVFRKTLMRSLAEDEENPSGASEVVAKPKPTNTVQAEGHLSSKPHDGDGDCKLRINVNHYTVNARVPFVTVCIFRFWPTPYALYLLVLCFGNVQRNDDLTVISEGDVTFSTLPPSRSSSVQSTFSEGGSTFTEDRDTDASRPRIAHTLLLASQTSTPRFTPPGSPPIYSASTSPTRTSKPGSPKRHSMSFATSRGMFDNRSSVPSSHHSSESGRTRVDGKEFFRQVRSRLSYEQFGAFLANVKELNGHKQTKEETLQKADEIFGPDNKDLYAIFEGLISRNIH